MSTFSHEAVEDPPPSETVGVAGAAQIVGLPQYALLQMAEADYGKWTSFDGEPPFSVGVGPRYKGSPWSSGTLEYRRSDLKEWQTGANTKTRRMK